MTADDLVIDVLGRCLLPSPVASHLGERGVQFVGEADKALLDNSLSGRARMTGELAAQPAFELAGPRDKIFFDPRTVRCAVGAGEAKPPRVRLELDPQGPGLDRLGTRRGRGRGGRPGRVHRRAPEETEGDGVARVAPVGLHGATLPEGAGPGHPGFAALANSAARAGLASVVRRA